MINRRLLKSEIAQHNALIWALLKQSGGSVVVPDFLIDHYNPESAEIRMTRDTGDFATRYEAR